MNKFIKRTVILLITFFFVDKLFYVFIAIAPGLEFDKRLEQVINGEMNKELVILGSSRGARNVIAGQIEDSLGCSAFNLSYPGSDVEFHEFLLESLIRFNVPPKKVLLVVDESREFLPSKELVFRLDRLYPLAKYSYINNLMIARGEKNFSSKFLVLSRMNVRNFNLLKKKFSAIDTISECGSMPISYQRENLVFDYDSTNRIYNPDSELDYKIGSFKNIQEICNTYGIDLYVVYSPNFRSYNLSFEHRINQLSDDRINSIYYNFSNPVYKEASYYYDDIHLQEKGAVIFTNDIIDYLQAEKDESMISSIK